MISPSRVRQLNDHPIASGRYVLYWMQQSQRTRFNHALELAIERANELQQPLLVAFGLMDDYPDANERHYAFMLEGLRDVAQGLRERGIKFIVRHGAPADVAVQLARDASLLICDRGYLRHQRRWRDHVADHAPCNVIEVESDVVVPLERVSQKQEFAARTIRPKIHRLWNEYLKPVKPRRLSHSSLALKTASDFDVKEVDKTLARLKIDRSVPRSRQFAGGEQQAQLKLKRFITERLAGYAENRNEPSHDGTSTMSSHLHFGQISALDLALAVQHATAPQVDKDAYLEELIVRRELSMNFAHFNSNYDSYAGVPDWARKALASCEKDKRPMVYTRAQLESAQTADPYWNAAQLEMVRTGFMHNYMRMYWGKKVLEWKQTAAEAYADLIYLNNKYFLCGRDANGYVGVAWIFGLHDRPWGPARPIFGTIRYMNAAGLQRKFDMEAYVKKVDALK